MSTSPLTQHPHFSEILARLCSGETPASVARAYSLNVETVRSWWKRNRKFKPREQVVEYDALGDDDGDIVEAVEAARAEAAKVGGRVSRVTVERRASTWDAQTGKGQIDELNAARSGARVTVVLPAFAEGERHEIRQAEPINVNVSMPRPAKRDKGRVRTAVVLPDEQWPFADHAAIDVAEQLVAYVEQTEGVDDLVWLGDNLDFPEVSRHRTAPSLLGSMQEGIDGYYRHMARTRAIASGSRAFWLLGNHEQRLTNWLVENSPSLLGLRRADAKDEDPVMSVEYLCRTKEIGVQVVGPYPEGVVWLTDSLRIEHGRFTGPHPEQKYLQEVEASTIYGHTHRAVLAYREIDRGPRGLRSYFAGSPGCLCRLDGKLPSTKTGISSVGKPGQRHAETWQQGVMVVRFDPKGGSLPSAHIIRIINGRAEWEGRIFEARCDIDGNAIEAAA